MEVQFATAPEDFVDAHVDGPNPCACGAPLTSFSLMYQLPAQRRSNGRRAPSVLGCPSRRLKASEQFDHLVRVEIFLRSIHQFLHRSELTATDEAELGEFAESHPAFAFQSLVNRAAVLDARLQPVAPALVTTDVFLVNVEMTAAEPRERIRGSRGRSNGISGRLKAAIVDDALRCDIGVRFTISCRP